MSDTIYLKSTPTVPPSIPASDPRFIKHIQCDGSRFHVISWSIGKGAQCSEPMCIVNKEKGKMRDTPRTEATIQKVSKDHVTALAAQVEKMKVALGHAVQEINPFRLDYYHGQMVAALSTPASTILAEHDKEIRRPLIEALRVHALVRVINVERGNYTRCKVCLCEWTTPELEHHTPACPLLVIEGTQQ